MLFTLEQNKYANISNTLAYLELETGFSVNRSLSRSNLKQDLYKACFHKYASKRFEMGNISLSY